MTTTDALFLLGLSTCTVLSFLTCTYIPKWVSKMVEDKAKEGKGSVYYVMYLSFVILLFVLAFAYV